MCVHEHACVCVCVHVERENYVGGCARKSALLSVSRRTAVDVKQRSSRWALQPAATLPGRRLRDAREPKTQSKAANFLNKFSLCLICSQNRLLPSAWTKGWRTSSETGGAMILVLLHQYTCFTPETCFHFKAGTKQNVKYRYKVFTGLWILPFIVSKDSHSYYSDFFKLLCPSCFITQVFTFKRDQAIAAQL